LVKSHTTASCAFNDTQSNPDETPGFIGVSDMQHIIGRPEPHLNICLMSPIRWVLGRLISGPMQLE
jgi:hypothetical protein